MIFLYVWNTFAIVSAPIFFSFSALFHILAKLFCYQICLVYSKKILLFQRNIFLFTLSPFPNVFNIKPKLGYRFLTEGIGVD